MRKVVNAIAAGLMLCTAVPAAAQAQARTPEQRQLRYQITTMESVLARAVEHGALVIRDRLQAAVPAEMLLSDTAHVVGYPLAGYGMVFNVEVPDLGGTLPWSFRTLDQYDLGLRSALNSIRAAIQKMNDADLEQALKRVELQVSPVTAALGTTAAAPASAASGSRFATGAAASAPDAQAAPAPPAAPDPILRNPDEAYRTEIRNALMDAMLDHSLGLNIAPGEVLTVVAKRREVQRVFGPPDSGGQTMTITVQSADLAEFRAAQISRDDARQRMRVTVF